MYINVINEHDMKIAVINSKDFYDLRTKGKACGRSIE